MGVLEQRQIGNELFETVRGTIEAAGADFIGLRGEDSVAFREASTGKVLTLYIFSCTSETVQLSLKAAREGHKEFTRWEPAR